MVAELSKRDKILQSKKITVRQTNYGIKRCIACSNITIINYFFCNIINGSLSNLTSERYCRK